jgi:hypothetical protein
MNPYSTRTQARIQPRDITIAALTDRHNAALSLSQLERRRGWQADVEMAWLLKQHAIAPESPSSRVAIVREAIGAALVRAGQRVGGISQRDVSPTMVPMADRLPAAG